MAAIDITQIGSEVRRILEETRQEIITISDTACEETCKETVKYLKANSPKKTGKYAKGWKFKKEGRKYIVYQKNKPNLTHLLEKGHATKSGGRTQSYKHIEPAMEVAKDVLMRKMLEELSR